MSESKTEQLQRIANEYMESGQTVPATRNEIAAWAIKTGRWAPEPRSLIQQLGEELSRAMREEYYTDPQGRRVRTKHVALIEQQRLWNDIRRENPDFFRLSFQQRRSQIVGDCRQLKTDVDSYNDNAKPETPIQLVLDFTDDVAELEALERLDGVA
jgi:hypothetical protein